jgi:arsenite/tail-anchored protein-transporting ATPase
VLALDNSTSASVAVKCADSGLSTLVISTDPAHSLGDALDQAVGGGQPVRVAGIDNLWAMEVDATEAIKVSFVRFALSVYIAVIVAGKCIELL